MSPTIDEYRLGGLVMHSDPIHDVLQAVDNLWPGIRADIHVTASEGVEVEGDGGDDHELSLGCTCFPCACHPDGPPQVFVDVAQPLIGVVDVLAHELAHVRVGPLEEEENDDEMGPGHGPRWRAALDAIQAEYSRIVEERVARLGGHLVAVHPDQCARTLLATEVPGHF